MKERWKKGRRTKIHWLKGKLTKGKLTKGNQAKESRQRKTWRILSPGWSWGILALCVLITLAAIIWRMERQDIHSWSWVIGNKSIVVDAGHGGVDPGAVSESQTLEKDITLAVAKYLKQFIAQGGGKAIMVREEDKDLGTSQGLLQRKREDLAQRIQLAADAQADVFLSIHVNSFPNKKLTGPQVFYHTDSVTGKELAQQIQKELNGVANGTRIAKSNQDYFILKKSTQAAVTIELGFLSNVGEEQKLKDPVYQQKLAWAIYQGLSRYFTQ